MRRAAFLRGAQASENIPPRGDTLGDFTMGVDVLRLVPLALVAGVLSTAIALVLLDLIGLVTNLAYRGTLDVRLLPPEVRTLGPLSILVPVAGGLVIGIMARYGSERIRGHGIPEAMETILVGGSRVEPRLALLKPISSAISIGTGGPFGAEGPIILTGGAFGSLVGQLFQLSAAERKTLLVAGAAAGMTAVFGTPIASVLLAVELLLFEWKPRSLIPVAAASALADALRLQLAAHGLVAAAPLFPVPAHAPLGDLGLLGAVALGLIEGVVAWLLTIACYGAEDAFRKLPVHWMWWPVIGGVFVGVGGLIEPRALGVGYDTIRAELAGEIVLSGLVALLVVKLLIWAIALGSGTSGGILAPLLMMGAAVGGILAPWLPGATPETWALIGMGAALAGVTRAPFTGVIFAFELTGDGNSLLPLLIACVTADLVSVLVLRRSILTEKVARRGFHVMREYGVDPLEALLVRDVMARQVVTAEARATVEATARQVGASVDAARQVGASVDAARQRLYPVLDAEGRLVGVVGRRELERAMQIPERRSAPAADVMTREMVVAHPDETLRHVADRMATAHVGILPVVERGDDRQLCGLVSQIDLLRARDRLLVEERHRERVLDLRPLAQSSYISLARHLRSRRRRAR